MSEREGRWEMERSLRSKRRKRGEDKDKQRDVRRKGVKQGTGRYKNEYRSREGRRDVMRRERSRKGER